MQWALYRARATRRLGPSITCGHDQQLWGGPDGAARSSPDGGFIARPRTASTWPGRHGACDGASGTIAALQSTCSGPSGGGPRGGALSLGEHHHRQPTASTSAVHVLPCSLRPLPALGVHLPFPADRSSQGGKATPSARRVQAKGGVECVPLKWPYNRRGFGDFQARGVSRPPAREGTRGVTSLSALDVSDVAAIWLARSPQGGGNSPGETLRRRSSITT